jgi:hypothetical protein
MGERGGEVGHATARPVTEPWAQPAAEVLAALGVARDRGLAAT